MFPRYTLVCTAAGPPAAPVDGLLPDGVVVGNYRCSLAGLDLNRVYEAPDPRLQPEIHAFKDMVKAFMQEREVKSQAERLSVGGCSDWLS